VHVETFDEGFGDGCFAACGGSSDADDLQREPRRFVLWLLLHRDDGDGDGPSGPLTIIPRLAAQSPRPRSHESMEIGVYCGEII
jgi:hypothetical protein